MPLTLSVGDAAVLAYVNLMATVAPAYSENPEMEAAVAFAAVAAAVELVP